MKKMYELETSRVISCAHRLVGYQGECCNLHGHNYRITVVLRAEELDRIGIAFDFKKLKAATDNALEGYDHACLNDLEDYRDVNPTSENMARVLYRKLAASINDGNVKVYAVKVAESDSSCATYFEP